MRLTLHTDYALRTLMLLALEPDEVHTIASIAKRYRISRNHLMKVAQTLIEAGFVDGIRGRNGGLKLAKPPAEIILGDVVRITEDGFALVECFDRKKNTCVVHSGMRSARSFGGRCGGFPRRSRQGVAGQRGGGSR